MGGGREAPPPRSGAPIKRAGHRRRGTAQVTLAMANTPAAAVPRHCSWPWRPTPGSAQPASRAPDSPPHLMHVCIQRTPRPPTLPLPLRYTARVRTVHAPHRGARTRTPPHPPISLWPATPSRGKSPHAAMGGGPPLPPPPLPPPTSRSGWSPPRHGVAGPRHGVAGPHHAADWLVPVTPAACLGSPPLDLALRPGWCGPPARPPPP